MSLLYYVYTCEIERCEPSPRGRQNARNLSSLRNRVFRGFTGAHEYIYIGGAGAAVTESVSLYYCCIRIGTIGKRQSLPQVTIFDCRRDLINVEIMWGRGGQHDL